MVQDFVNHHVHSHFSTLDGLSTPQEIVETAVRLGQRSISVTDHGSMSSIPQMYKAAHDAGIGFTPGCEMYFATDRHHKGLDRLGEKYYHLIMLANNNEGYTNLSKLQTIAWQDGYYYKPRCDYEALNRYHKGLTVTTSCLAGIVNQYLLRDDIAAAEKELSTFIDIFGKDNVYVELQNHGIPEQLRILGYQRDLAKRFDLKMLATTDSHYCVQEECDVHDSLLCTGTKSQKAQTNRFKFSSDKHFLHSAEQMLELFPGREFPGAVTNTVELAEKSEFTMNMGDDKEYLMPVTGTPEGKTDDEVLRERVILGAQSMERYGDEEGLIPDDVMKRIDYELDVIRNMRFSSYFLIVQNLIELFEKNGIHTGPGRGCLHPDTSVKTQRGWIPIKNVSSGDKVMTAQGLWSPVHEVLKHAVADGEKLVSLTTEYGKTLRTTEKHKILVQSSGSHEWRKAIDISPGDTVILIDGDSSIAPSHVTHGDDYGVNICHSSTAQVVEKDMIDTDTSYVYDIVVSHGGHPSFLTDAATVHNSAPGSVVVYCLGIVDVDPLEHNLFFERFLNPDRVSMPDIDVDIPKSHRQRALMLIEEEYGKGHVAHMSNYNTMGMRDSIVRAAKVFGMSPSEANKFRDIIATWCEDHGESLHDFANRGVPPQDIAKKLPHTNYYHDIITTASKFVGRIMGNGVHASGILITDKQLDDSFPIRMSKDNTLPVCQYDGKDTESIGGVKFDLLGLINLDECEDTERNILLDLGEEVDSTELPYDDKEVYSMLSAGHGGGIFQLGCLAGDTLIDGMRIDVMYKLRNSIRRVDKVPAFFMGKGAIDYHSVIDIVSSGIKDTIIIATAHGNSLRCTPEHKLWTVDGWKNAGDIQPHDSVLVSTGELDKWGVRGRQDIVDAYLSYHPTWMQIPQRRHVSIGGTFCYPDVVSPDGDNYAYFYPDDNEESGQQLRNKVKNITTDDGAPVIEVLSYSEVIERMCESLGKKGQQQLLTPVGCFWDTVTSTTPSGECETYDIMMEAPVHNFIANNIVTHNSSGIQSLLRHMKPTEFKNIPALLALYRPGPMGTGTHDEYCERKKGTSSLDVLHPDMSTHLHDTYNLMVYQEDAMSIARDMAGYTGGEADDLRKAMAKKDPAMMEKHRKKFIPAVNKKYGNDLGTQLWDIIVPFGAYAFNKCVSGDTEVILVSPDIEETYTMTIADMHSQFTTVTCTSDDDTLMVEQSETPYTFCVNPDDHTDIRMTPIVDIHDNGVAETYTVTTQQGKTITTTSQHRFVTPYSYRRLSEMSHGDHICILDNGEVVYDTIVDISYNGKTHVYDVEVDEPYHNWSAGNGIMTHNSHSVAYGLITYRTAWLKAHYPAQFSGAVMDQSMSSHDKIFETISWIRKTGVDILPPNIQQSEMRSVTTKDSISLPLHIIKGVGYKKAVAIIDERNTNGPFSSVVDAVARCGIPASMMINMAKSGAFDCFGVDRASVIAHADTIMALAQSHKSAMKLKDGLFGNVIESSYQDDSLDLSTPVTHVLLGNEDILVDDTVRGQWEREMMGVLLGTHPFEQLRNSPAAERIFSKYPPVDEFTRPERDIACCGVMYNISRRTSGAGKPYTIFNLETDIASVPAMKFKTHLDNAEEGMFVVVKGSIDNDSKGYGNDDGDDEFSPKIFCDSITPLNMNKIMGTKQD